MDLDDLLAEYVQSEHIPLFGIANASGFEHALPGWHPRELMPRCESVILFGHAFIEHPLRIEEKTHRANDSWWEVNEPVDDEVNAWRAGLVNLLDMHGLAAANFGGYGPRSEPSLSYRLAQYEAGMGVFGRFGVCVNPELGCYYRVGVLLTDATLAPTDRDALSDFSPCEGCSACAEVCPVRAIDASQAPERGYDRDLCVRFILQMKERSGQEAKYCGRCFGVCPWGVGRFG